MAIMNLGNHRLSDIDTNAYFDLGETYESSTSEGTKVFQYVEYEQATGSVTCHSKQVLVPYSTSTSDDFTKFKYTGDVSDTIVSACSAAGVAQARLTDGKFGWIQRKGRALIEVGTTPATTLSYGEVLMAGAADLSVDRWPQNVTATTGALVTQLGYANARIGRVAKTGVAQTATASTVWVDLFGEGL